MEDREAGAGGASRIERQIVAEGHEAECVDHHRQSRSADGEAINAVDHFEIVIPIVDLD
ncbi:hypothetical protein D3C72_1737870 [compost metagenome]